MSFSESLTRRVLLKALAVAPAIPTLLGATTARNSACILE
jgi:hypothetical protein